MTKSKREWLNKEIHQLAFDLDSVQGMIEGKNLTEAQEAQLLGALLNVKHDIQAVLRAIGANPSMRRHRARG